MITVHVFCSYKLSSSGFQYGTFVYNPDESGECYYLSDNYKIPFVSTSFNYDLVKRVCGKLPMNTNNENYIFLFKKISYVYGDEHEETGKDVTMNMAFEFDNFSQFSIFISAFSKEEKQNIEKLSKELANCIIPDLSVEKYKLFIHKKLFDIWVQDKLHNIKTDKDSNLKKEIKITVISSQSDYSKELIDYYKFYEYSENEKIYELKRKGETADYYYPKKKEQQETLSSSLSKLARRHFKFLFK